MTDALAEWFVSEKEKALQVISGWNTQQDFENSIIEQRKQSLYNDDSAILIIKVEEDNSPLLNYKNISVADFNQLLEVEKNEIEKKLSERESIQIKPTEINKSEREAIQETPVEENTNVVDAKDASNTSDSNIIVEIIKLDKNEKKGEETRLDNKDRNDKRLKKQKKDFWEFFVSPFWHYWHEDIEDEIISSNSENEEKVNAETIQIQSELDQKDKKNSSKGKELDDSKLQGKDKPVNKIKDENLKSMKKSEESSKPDEDISSITDKF